MNSEPVGVVLLGAVGVGKSALLLRFLRDEFIEFDPTIEDIYTKEMEVDEEPCTVNILDTAGDPTSLFRELHIRQAQGYLFVYDLTSAASMRELKYMVDERKKIKEGNFPMIIVGNKCDLEEERQVSVKEGEELGQLYNCPYYETSAKVQINVKEIFDQLIREIRIYHKNNPPISTKRKNCTIS